MTTMNEVARSVRPALDGGWRLAFILMMVLVMVPIFTQVAAWEPGESSAGMIASANAAPEAEPSIPDGFGTASAASAKQYVTRFDSVSPEPIVDDGSSLPVHLPTIEAGGAEWVLPVVQSRND